MPTPIDKLRAHTKGQREEKDHTVQHDLDRARTDFVATIDEFAAKIAAHGYRDLEYYLWEDAEELYIGKEIERGPVGNRLIVLFDEEGQHTVVRAGEQSYVHRPAEGERDAQGDLILILKNPRVDREVVIDEKVRRDGNRMQEINQKLAFQQPEDASDRHSEWHVFDVNANTTDRDTAALEISASRVKHWNDQLTMGRFGQR